MSRGLHAGVEKGASIWAAEKHERDFEWQEGYAAFTASWTHIEAVHQYIVTQEEHHRKTDFIAELKTLLDKNGVKYDEKYLL